MLFLGTSGLQTPIAKRDFPPPFKDKSRLSFYASLFNSIEINSTFYKLPQATTIRRWAEEVPDDFRFTFKLWRDITHSKDFLFEPDDVRKFMQTISQVGDKKGCLLVQLPPSRSASSRLQLEHLLSLIHKANKGNDWKVMVEFRNKTWYADPIYEMLATYNADIVFHDLPYSSPPLRGPEGATAYVRFHGPDGRYKGSYSDAFLSEYATYTHGWIAGAKTVYVYFNNTAGNALDNLLTFKNSLQSLLK